jgi:hypothetical protein
LPGISSWITLSASACRGDDGNEEEDEETAPHPLDYTDAGPRSEASNNERSG